MALPTYLTPAEAAAATRRHRVTIYRALEAGELHGYQRVEGGRWTIAEPCLEAWIAQRRCEHQLRLSPQPVRRSTRRGG